MKYPEWAPPILIEYHKNRVNQNSPKNNLNIPDLESIVTDVALNNKNISNNTIEDFRRRLYRTPISVPNKKGTMIIEQLITDFRMKCVWKTLAKRIDNSYEFIQFVKICECIIVAWKGQLKQTTSEHKKFYKELNETTAKLCKLIYKSDRLDLYSIESLIDDKSITWFQKTLCSPKDISSTRSSLSKILPSIYDVLIDLSKKSKQFSKESPSVKKPNSPNAEIHFFVRNLSWIFQQRFNQPLHEAVAITTSVIFNKQNIDTDYVRKLVR